MSAVCLYLCLLILAVTAFCVVLSGKSIASRIRIACAGFISACIILVLPLSLSETGPGDTLNILIAMQAATLNAPYNDILGSVDGGFYRNLLAGLLIVSPLLLAGAVLTFFENAVRWCKYFVFSRFRDVYYFSELNERSLALANNITELKAGKNRRRPLIVFCNLSADNRLRGDACGRGYILFETSGCDVKISGRHSRLHFFEIRLDTSENASGAERLIRRFSNGRYKDRVKIYLFTDHPEAEIVMDATDKKGLPVTVISEPLTAAYNLLFDKPLYSALQETGDNKLSVLVVGAGKIGLEIIKAAAWCGQMDGIALEITAVDVNAEFIEQSFRMECPELMGGEYDIRFLRADVRTCQFEEALREYCRDANYIVVALGCDRQNIKTALFLRGHYLRSCADFLREPVICVQVSDNEKSRILSELTAVSRGRLISKKWDYDSDRAQNFNLFPFGSYESVYSYSAIVDSPVENLAINVHAAYMRTFAPEMNAEAILRDYHANEANKRSSRANAIHIAYKLYALGFDMTSRNEDDEMKPHGAAEALLYLRSLLNDRERLLRLAKMEHYRWNAFQRSEGYRSATIEQTEIYKARTNGSHIHRRAKLHVCICDWDDLPRIAGIYDKNMIDYDIEMIRNIPAIIGAEEDGAANLGGVSYSVAKRRLKYEANKCP